jgi:hypothetical protein
MQLTVDVSRLIGGAAFGVGWVLVQGALWQLVLRVFGARVRFRDALAQLWFANLGKYLPGKVWAAVGRVTMCTRCGVTAAVSGVALFVENVSFILAGALVAAVLLPVAGLTAPAALGRLPVAVAGAVVLGLVIVHPRVWGSLARLVLERLGRPPVAVRVTYPVSLALVLCYVGSWTVLCAGMFVWSGAFIPFDAGLGFRIVGLYVVSWSVGYVTMVAPAGLGVREGIMMAGLAGTMPPEQVIAVTLALRVFFTLVDVLGVLAAAVASPRLVGAMWSGRREP